MSWAIVGSAAIGGISGAVGSRQNRKAAEAQERMQTEQGRLGRKTRLDELRLSQDIGRSAQQRGESALNRFLGSFEQSTSGTPQQVTRLQSLIREQALPEQQRAMAQGNIARQQAGVRGIDASVLAQRQANQLNKQLAMQAEQVGLQQALADRRARQNLYSGLAGGSLGSSIQGTSNRQFKL